MHESFPISPRSEAYVDSGIDAERIHDVQLAHLAARVVEAAMRGDLVEVAKAHIERTGVDNPNSYGKNDFRIGEPVVQERGDAVYRSVNERAIEDLGDSGIVRGAMSAGKKANTSGHTTYWHRGEDDKGRTLGQGFVIEAPLEAAQNGWVTADEVTGIYARDNDGSVKNILPKS